MTSDEWKQAFDIANDPQVLWDEDCPPTLEDENLAWSYRDGRVDLIGRGGLLQEFNPDPDLDAALLAALETTHE